MANRTKRGWHPKFKEYAEFIVTNPNYKGLFYNRTTDGIIKWVITGKSEDGLKRKKWWNQKCIENKIKIQPGCYAKIAALIHPTKKHTCQICGKELFIKYVYPNKRLLNNLNNQFGVNYSSYHEDIFQILKSLIKNSSDVEKIIKIFKIKKLRINTKQDLFIYILHEFVDKSDKSFLSPGVMSNSPDRFDGYHSDGNCCRSESDKGRHKINLSRYSQDRRVYENWADGDWKKADRLMSCFSRHGLSADHIGPISLGFCHRPKFQPMTREQNSTKNNRMSLKDVKSLIKDEKNGEQVVSWHSKYIWDNLKDLVKSDKDAVRLSVLMRKNLHHILIIFSVLHENKYDKFLVRFLHPEFSYFDYKFIDFNPKDGTYKSFIKIERKGKNQQNNAKRYIKIAFDELKKYKNINNRKTKIWINKEVDKEIKNLLNLLNQDQFNKSEKKLKDILGILANNALIS